MRRLLRGRQAGRALVLATGLALAAIVLAALFLIAPVWLPQAEPAAYAPPAASEIQEEE